MPQTLAEYADWLDRRNLLWPEVPPSKPVKATPFLKPLPGIKAVTIEIYGTLLRITGGRLTFDGPDRLSLQVALEKTIEEFHVWNHLYRKPGAAWKQVYEQYVKFIEERRLTAAVAAGDVPEVDAARDVWRKLIEQWDRKDFTYDEATLGNRDQLAEKIAYFFHSRLQGVEASQSATTAIEAAVLAGKVVTLLSDAQCFTLVQLRRALARHSTSVTSMIDEMTSVLSFEEGIRKPSPSLYRMAVEKLRDRGIEPHQVVHVGSRLKDDLAVAKRLGIRTALYAGDSESFAATKSEVRDPQLAPDRLLTDLSQLGEVLGIG